MAKPTRDDLEPWADELFVGVRGLAKRKTFGCPSYYTGRKMAAFLWKDGLGIKLPPDAVAAKVAEDPDVYRHFNPGDGVMKNWLIIVRPEAAEYEADLPLIETTLASVGGRN